MAEDRWVRRQSIASSGRASTVSIPSKPGEKYDALNTEKIAGSINYRDRSVWNPEATSFIKSNPGGNLEGQWVGVRPLGQGSYGIAGLWEKRNVDGRVVDRMVIKQSHGGLNYKWDPKVPNEVRIMKLLNKTHCRGMVRLRAYRRYCHKKVHRLYLRYCPHGDLRRLIDRYRRFRHYLPEPFLWEVFYYLADAADAMANGPQKGPDDNDEDDWDFQIVHMDIKPDNIFLGYEDEDSGGVPYYPTAKLGDFGVSRECYLKDPNNPNYLMEAGTRGWQAPEQLQTFFDVRKLYKKSQFKIYGHTNIWAIGAVMYELMTLRKVDQIWLYEARDLHDGINKIITLHRPEYSMALENTIRNCLKPYPEERPSAHELLEQIEAKRKRMHEHLSGEAGADPTKPTPGAGQRLYYRGNEINEMRPGKERPNPDEEEEDPSDADGKFRDPKLSPVIFPKFSDAVFSKKKPNKNKDLGKNDIVRESEGIAKSQAETKAVWNKWHARENDGKDLRAHCVEDEHEEEEDPDDYSGDGDGGGVSSDSLSVDVGSEYGDEVEEDPDDYSGDGEWASNPSDSTNANSGESRQSRKRNQGTRPSNPKTNLSSSSKGKRKTPGNEPAGPEQEEEEEDQEDQSPIQNLRRNRERKKLLHLQTNPSPSSKAKRKAPRNNPADVEQEEDDDQSPTLNDKRRRGRKHHPILPEPPANSEEPSEDEQPGVGLEAGDQAEQEDTEGEVDDKDDDDDEYKPATRKAKGKPCRAASWASQSYRPPRRRVKRRALRKK